MYSILTIKDALLKYRKNKQWTIVQICNCWWYMLDGIHGEKQHITNYTTFILMQNGFGKRKCEHTTTSYVGKHLKDISYRHPVYVQRIFPWLKGADLAPLLVKDLGVPANETGFMSKRQDLPSDLKRSADGVVIEFPKKKY